MNLGKLRHRIVIQSRTVTRGELGGELESWSEHSRPHAAVDLASSGEGASADAQIGENRYRILIRYRTGIDKTMRVVWGAKTLEIVSVDDTRSRQGELYLEAREVDA